MACDSARPGWAFGLMLTRYLDRIQTFGLLSSELLTATNSPCFILPNYATYKLACLCYGVLALLEPTSVSSTALEVLCCFATSLFLLETHLATMKTSGRAINKLQYSLKCKLAPWFYKFTSAKSPLHGLSVTFFSCQVR